MKININTLKKTLLIFIIIASSTTIAQVNIKVRVNRVSYLKYEPVKVCINIKNTSGNVLFFGDEKTPIGKIKIIVTKDGKEILSERKTAKPIASNLSLRIGEEKQIIISLAQIYSIQKTGNYSIYVQVGHKRFRTDFRSKEVFFNIKEGLQIWSQMIGVPEPNSTNQIQTRKVSIQLYQGQKNDYYYLMIEDDKMVYNCTRLGTKIDTIKPQCEVDAISNIHILFQIRPRNHIYLIYDYNGKKKQELYYTNVGNSLPRLVRDPDLGQVKVAGGKKTVEGKDIFKYGQAPDPNPYRANQLVDGPYKAPDDPKKEKKKKKKGGLKKLWPGNWFKK